MKTILLKVLLKLGIKGKRHSVSGIRLNRKSYKANRLAREKRILDDMHINGVGV